MLITRVELQNVKSYRDDTVTFTAGTNAICGENGAGKSTLLEAIGFALFDYLSYTQADFVREGEKTATVGVHFVSNLDSREYQVVRRFGGALEYFVYDPELDAKIAVGKVDVLEWLKEHLGVEPTADLTALFRDAVGVPQGLLTAPFLQTPAQRKPLFDRLLRVDEYEQAWKTLRDTTRYLEDTLADRRETIARLETRVQRLPGLRQRAEGLLADAGGIEASLNQLQTELDHVSARREAMEATKQELDALTQRVQMLTTRLQGVSEQVAGAETAVSEAEAAQAALETSQTGYQAYQAAQAALSELEGERDQRDRLRDQRASQATGLRLAQERVKSLEASLSEVEEAEAHRDALQPQVMRQTELETALRAAQEELRLLDLTEAGHAERQRQRADLQARLETVLAGLVTADRIEAERQQTRARLAEEQNLLADLKSEQAALDTEARRLADQTQALEIATSAACPVCEKPLTPQHRADLLARNQAQLEGLRAQEQLLSERIADSSRTSSELERQLQNLEGQLSQLPRRADKDNLAAQIASLENDLTRIRAEIGRLEGSRNQVTALEQELVALGDPRRQYERLAEAAGQRAHLEEQLEAERHALSALQASLVEIEQALAPLADLDQRLGEQRAILHRHEEDYRRYLGNAQIAATLPSRRAHAESLRAQQAELTAERDARLAEVEGVAAAFDPDAFAAARQREAQLQAERAGLQGQLERLSQQISDTQAEIEELEAEEKTLTVEQATLAAHQRLLAVIEFVREIIRRAGPYVTRRMIQQVSIEAARLFADVMADYTARLRWEENYEIVLEKNGRDRNFQQLSGGEQMAAALAVRLALLRELSSIDIAFFDEPTSNLDDFRRDSLAEQILSVKGFSQLFVISHDDTFERVTNHVVRVRKEDGVSKVDS